MSQPPSHPDADPPPPFPAPAPSAAAGPPRPIPVAVPVARPDDGWRPWVTYTLIAANLAAFAFELSMGGGVGGMSLEGLVSVGANFGPLTRGGQPWRLLTAMFLHDGAMHVGMNMVCLYQVGMVERFFGRAQFLALYFASGLLGGLASVVIHPNAVCVGASGAVFGMFGAFAAIMVARRKQMDAGAWRRTMRSLATFFGINLAFGLAQSGIDMSAHIGGAAVGFLGAFVLTKTARPESNELLRALVVAALGAGTALAGLYVLPG